MTVLVEAENPCVSLETWRKVEPFWWVSSIDFDWRDWTWYVGTPPATPQQESTGMCDYTKQPGILGIYPRVPETSRYWWRHPTYEEAVERQRRFNEATRKEWEHWMNYGSYTNVASLAPSRGYQGGLPGSLIITNGGREYEAEERLGLR